MRMFAFWLAVVLGIMALNFAIGLMLKLTRIFLLMIIIFFCIKYIFGI